MVNKPKNNNFIATNLFNQIIKLEYADNSIEYISEYDYNKLYLIKTDNILKKKYEQLTLF